jgi:hypothetical protein
LAPEVHAFSRKQPPLQLDRITTASVAAYPSAGRDHAMTGHDERHRIPRHDAADGTRGTRPAGKLGQLTVRDGLAPRHPLDESLEHGTAQG